MKFETVSLRIRNLWKHRLGTHNSISLFVWNIQQRGCWCCKYNPFGLVSFFLAIIIKGGSWKYTHIQMILLETCLKERYIDLKINRLRSVWVEKFPGADLWHFSLTSALNSAMFLIKSQPGAIMWSAQEGPSHPPISHWRVYCFHDTDDGLFSLGLLTSKAGTLPSQAKLSFLELTVNGCCSRLCVCVCVCVACLWRSPHDRSLEFSGWGSLLNWTSLNLKDLETPSVHLRKEDSKHPTSGLY